MHIVTIKLLGSIFTILTKIKYYFQPEGNNFWTGENYLGTIAYLFGIILFFISKKMHEYIYTSRFINIFWWLS